MLKLSKTRTYPTSIAGLLTSIVAEDVFHSANNMFDVGKHFSVLYLSLFSKKGTDSHVYTETVLFQENES